MPTTIRVVDSHTEGEPTRVVIEGWPEPDGRHDGRAARRSPSTVRSSARAVVCEPRGHAADRRSAAHSARERRLVVGDHLLQQRDVPRHVRPRPDRRRPHARIPRPAAARASRASIHRPAALQPNSNADGSVTIENVASRCHALDVEVDVPGIGRVVGDVGYSGNWFFLTHLPLSLEISNVGESTRATQAIQDAHHRSGRGRRRSDRPHRGRPARRRDPTPTRETSCSARAASTTARRAEPGRRR